jgi:hypothetical protein
MTLPHAIHAAVQAAMHGHHSRIPALGCEWMTEPGSPDLHIDQLGARHHVVMPCKDVEAVADNLVYRLALPQSERGDVVVILAAWDAAAKKATRLQ